MITYFGKNRCKRHWHKFGASYGQPQLTIFDHEWPILKVLISSSIPVMTIYFPPLLTTVIGESAIFFECRVDVKLFAQISNIPVSNTPASSWLLFLLLLHSRPNNWELLLLFKLLSSSGEL